jgi:phosphopantothenate synthetase
MINVAKKFKKLDKSDLNRIVKKFNNQKNIQETLNLIIDYIKIQKTKAFETIGL